MPRVGQKYDALACHSRRQYDHDRNILAIAWRVRAATEVPIVTISRNALLALAIGACGPTPGIDASAAVSEDALYSYPTFLWTSDEMPVCWIDPIGGEEEEREWVRAALARSWSFVADVEMTGWEECDPYSEPNETIRIEVRDDEVGPVSGFGVLALEQEVGVRLQFEFEEWRTDREDLEAYDFAVSCTPSSSESERKQCIENITIHEFGHLLGFFHEQDGPLDECEEGLLFGGGYYDGVVDVESVMYYCKDGYLGPRLSALDVRGGQYYFGMGPRFIAAAVASVL